MKLKGELCSLLGFCSLTYYKNTKTLREGAKMRNTVYGTRDTGHGIRKRDTGYGNNNKGGRMKTSEMIESKEMKLYLLNLCMWYAGEFINRRFNNGKLEDFGKRESEIYDRVRGKKAQKMKRTYNSVFDYYFQMMKERMDVYGDLLKKKRKMYEIMIEALEAIENVKVNKGKDERLMKVYEKFDEYDSKNGDQMLGVIRCMESARMFYELKYFLHGRIKRETRQPKEIRGVVQPVKSKKKK